MLTAILILLVIVLILVIYIAVGIRLMPRITAGLIRKEMKTMSERFARLTAVVAAQSTVVAGVATAFADLTAQVKEQADALRDAGVDTTELDATIGRIEENTTKLAQAAAIGTPASGEVHEDDGGTGDDDSAVEPAPVPVEEPAGAGEQQEEQQQE